MISTLWGLPIDTVTSTWFLVIIITNNLYYLRHLFPTFPRPRPSSPVPTPFIFVPLSTRPILYITSGFLVLDRIDKKTLVEHRESNSSVTHTALKRYVNQGVSTNLQDQDSLLVKRQNDNHSPGPVIREISPQLALEKWT